MYFVDFLRPPVIDDQTGDVLEANPSFYESSVYLQMVKDLADSKMAAFNE